MGEQNIDPKFLLRILRDVDRIADKALQCLSQQRELMRLYLALIKATSTEEMRAKLELAIAGMDERSAKEIDHSRNVVISRLSREIANKKGA